MCVNYSVSLLNSNAEEDNNECIYSKLEEMNNRIDDLEANICEVAENVEEHENDIKSLQKKSKKNYMENFLNMMRIIACLYAMNSDIVNHIWNTDLDTICNNYNKMLKIENLEQLAGLEDEEKTKDDN